MEVVERITKSSRYQLLLHTGWRQPGLEASSAIPVWIRGGQVFDAGYSSIDQAMTDASIELKVLVDQMREQVQNIE